MLNWRNLQNKQREKVGDKWIETDRIFTKWNGLTLDGTAPGYFYRQFCYFTSHLFRETQARALDALADTINFSKAVGQ